MSLLTKEEILRAEDREFAYVDVPEWGGTVKIATMSGFARDKYEAIIYRDRDKLEDIDNLRARFIAFCLVDEQGDLLFTPGEVAFLGQKSAKALDRVFEAASNLNATGVEGLEEAAKNS